MAPQNTATHRPAVVATLFAILTVATALDANLMQAQQPRNESQAGRNQLASERRQVKLYDQLRVGLKATTKADFSFLNRVVVLVNTGKLPRRLVDSTFLWARERANRQGKQRRLRPMVYFRPALTIRALAFRVRL